MEVEQTSLITLSYPSVLKRYTWVLFFIIAIVVLSYTHVALNTFDQRRYLSMAWFMYQTHHYLIPTLNGHLYHDKPPLLFWLIVMGWHLFGASIFWPQCLMYIFYTIGIVLSVKIYKLLFPEDDFGAFILPYLYIGSISMLAYLNKIRVDFILVDACLFCHYNLFKLRRNLAIKPFLPLGGIIIATFVGLMSKGPIFFIFTLIPYCLVAVLFESYKVHRNWILSSFVIGTLLVLGWLIPAIKFSDHTYVQQILYKQIFGRYASYHSSIITYVVNYLPYILLPWILAIPLVKNFKATLRGIYQKEPLMLLIIVIGLLILSLWGQKRPRYLFPLVPFFMIYLTYFYSQNRYNKQLNYFLAHVCSIISGGMGLLIFGMLCIPKLQSLILLQKFSSDYSIISFFIGISFMGVSIYCFKYKKLFLKNIIFYTTLNFLGALACTVIILGYRLNASGIMQVGQILKNHFTQNRPLATYLIDYHGDLNYLGKFTKNIITLSSIPELSNWLQHNPDGMILSENHCPLNLKVVAVYPPSTFLQRELLCIP